MGILGGGFWVQVRFQDYSPMLTYTHIYFEFWLWEAFTMFNIYMYWERNPLIDVDLKFIEFPYFIDEPTIYGVFCPKLRWGHTVI